MLIMSLVLLPWEVVRLLIGLLLLLIGLMLLLLKVLLLQHSLCDRIRLASGGRLVELAMEAGGTSGLLLDTGEWVVSRALWPLLVG
jgi:hypothetical protein